MYNSTSTKLRDTRTEPPWLFRKLNPSQAIYKRHAGHIFNAKNKLTIILLLDRLPWFKRKKEERANAKVKVKAKTLQLNPAKRGTAGKPLLQQRNNQRFSQ